MTERELWDRYRAGLFEDESAGFRLDVSRMSLDDHEIESLSARLEHAFDSMDALERGAVANPTENRMVGHYWLRAPSLAPDPKIARAIEGAFARIIEFSKRVHDGTIRPPHADRFRHLLVIGIGGSALGPQFVADALGGANDLMVPRFLDNTDPDGMDRVLHALAPSLNGTLSIVISKSGGTPETRNGMLEAAAAYRAKGLDFAPHAVAITQEGSALDRTAVHEGLLDRFPMWDWVGGRTSELSPVGLLPAALQGIDVGALLEGAAAMDRLTRVRDPRRNPAALLALCWHRAGDGKGNKSMVVLPYKDRLALFGRYLQQLVMESLGKERDLSGNVVHQGLTVYGNKGSTDQHAYVQQLRDGRPDFFVTFLQVLKDREGESIEVEPEATSGDFLHGLLLGTRRALHENGRGSITIALHDLSPRAVGALIAVHERAVGLYASLVRVNAYDQPGVEAGKKAAASVLELQRLVLTALRRRGMDGGTCTEIAADAGFPDEVESVFHVLEHLRANPSRGITSRPGRDRFESVYRYQAR